MRFSTVLVAALSLVCASASAQVIAPQQRVPTSDPNIDQICDVLPGTATPVCSRQLNKSAGTVKLLPSALPNPTTTTPGGAYAAQAGAHQYSTGISISGLPTFAQPDAVDVTFTQLIAGAATRTTFDKLGEIALSPLDVLPLVGNGTTPADAAFTILFATSGGEITIPPGTYRLSTSMTWPAGKVYRFAPGARILPDAAAIETIRGQIEAPLQQIFAGAGSVVGLKVNRPEWWGASNVYGYTAGRDDAPAFNKAMASAAASASVNGVPSDGLMASVEFGGIYYLCSPWDIYPASNFSPRVFGGASNNGGSILNACPTFSTTRGTGVVQVHGVPYGTDSTVNFHLADFSVRNTIGSGAVDGIRTVPEGAGYWLNGLHPGKIENVYSYDFTNDFNFTNTLQLEVDRSSGWNSGTSNLTSFLIQAVGPGNPGAGNSGEVFLNNVQGVPCGNPTSGAAACTGTYGVRVLASGGSETAAVHIKGVFEHMNCGVCGTASGGGTVNDVWVEAGTQFDGPMGKAVAFNATGSGSTINNIHVDHTYATANLAGNILHLFTADSGATFGGVFDNDNWYAGLQSQVVSILGVQNGQIHNNVMTGGGANGQADIQIGSLSSGISVLGNQAVGAVGYVPSAVVQVDAATDYISVSSNVGGVVTTNVVNNSTGTHNVIGDDGAAWTAYTPTAACGSGTLTTASAIGRYKKLGAKTTALSLSEIVTTLGSCSGSFTLSLPNVPNQSFTLVGRDQNTDARLFGDATDTGTTILVRKTDGTFPLVTGSNAKLGGTYENQ